MLTFTKPQPTDAGANSEADEASIAKRIAAHRHNMQHDAYAVMFFRVIVARENLLRHCARSHGTFVNALTEIATPGRTVEQMQGIATGALEAAAKGR